MGHIFRPGITGCRPGPNLILLDVCRDRYIGLGDAARDACLRLVEGQPAAIGDPAIIDGLITRDILRRVDGNARPQLCPPATEINNCALHAPASPYSGAVLAAVARHAFAILELKTRPLAVILARLARAKRRLSSVRDDNSDLAAIAASFAHADRIMAAFDRCLPRSIALSRAMLSTGLAPDLILGVKLRPFEAHCWVQQGPCLLSDVPATIAPFTPILIL